LQAATVLQLAKTTVALAEKGLARRRRLDGASHDESRYLQPIQEYVRAQGSRRLKNS